jgi:hypothetical protein
MLNTQSINAGIMPGITDTCKPAAYPWLASMLIGPNLGKLFPLVIAVISFKSWIFEQALYKVQ